MVTFWLLIDTIAMIGSPASRGAAASVVCSGRAWRGAASAGGAAVSAVRAAVAASVTIAGGAHRRTTSVDWAVVHRFAMPCPGCQGGIRVETNTEVLWQNRVGSLLGRSRRDQRVAFARLRGSLHSSAPCRRKTLSALLPL